MQKSLVSRLTHFPFNRLVICVLFALILPLAAQAQSENELAKEAQAYMEAGNFQQAIKHYDELISRNPKNPEYWTSRGWSKLNASGFTEGKKDLEKALELNKQCSRCKIGLAIFSFQARNLNSALELANQAIQFDDTASFNYFIRAQIYESAGKDALAGFDYTKAIRLNPYNPDYYYTKGNYEYRKGNFALAVDDFSKAIALQKKVGIYYFQRGSAYLEMEDVKSAKSDVLKALYIDSTNGDFWLGLGVILEAEGEIAQAYKAYNECLKLDPQNSLAYYNRGNIFYTQGLLEKSCYDFHMARNLVIQRGSPRRGLKQELENLITNHCDTNYASFYYQRGVVFLEDQNYYSAERVMDLGLKKWPKHPLLLIFRANASLYQMEFREADSLYTLALSNTSDIPEDLRNNLMLRMNMTKPEEYMRRLYAGAYESRSRSRIGLGQLDSAARDVEKAMFLLQKFEDADITGIQLLKANIYAAMGRNQETKDLISAMLLKNDKIADAYVIRARLLMKEAMQQDYRRFKHHYEVSDSSGLFYIRIDRYKARKINELVMEGALQDCNTAIVLNPENSEAYFIRAQVKFYSGKKDYCNDLEKARSLGISDAYDLIEGSVCVEPIPVEK